MSSFIQPAYIFFSVKWDIGQTVINFPLMLAVFKFITDTASVNSSINTQKSPQFFKFIFQSFYKL